MSSGTWGKTFTTTSAPKKWTLLWASARWAAPKSNERRYLRGGTLSQQVPFPSAQKIEVVLSFVFGVMCRGPGLFNFSCSRCVPYFNPRPTQSILHEQLCHANIPENLMQRGLVWEKKKGAREKKERVGERGREMKKKEDLQPNCLGIAFHGGAWRMEV